MKRWNVIHTKSGEVLGTIVRFRRNVGTLAKPVWRVWFQLDHQPEVNGNSRGMIAAYLSAEKTTMEEVR